MSAERPIRDKLHGPILPYATHGDLPALRNNPPVSEGGLFLTTEDRGYRLANRESTLFRGYSGITRDTRELHQEQAEMRASFNTTVTLLDGPGTATPGFPRIVDAPARLVNDQYFVDFSAPLNASGFYLTMEVDEPRASVNTDLGGGVWQFDYSKADRAQVASVPGVTWLVVRVELCTWPDDGAPYWRASLTEDTTPPVPCIDTYAESYTIRETDTLIEHVLVRLGDTLWGADGWFLTAEVGGVGDGCLSEWLVNKDGDEWRAPAWNGIGEAEFTDFIGTSPPLEVFVTP